MCFTIIKEGSQSPRNYIKDATKWGGKEKEKKGVSIYRKENLFSKKKVKYECVCVYIFLLGKSNYNFFKKS